MTKSKDPHHNPHPELSAPIVDRSLEARISFAESAVMARDKRIREHVGVISNRISTGPHRFVRERLGIFSAAAGVAIGVVAFIGWRRYTRNSSTAAQEAPSHQARWSLLSFFPTVWRLLPGAIKNPARRVIKSDIHHVAALIARFVRRQTATHATAQGQVPVSAPRTSSSPMP
jgi:hypothetical protein